MSVGEPVIISSVSDGSVAVEGDAIAAAIVWSKDELPIKVAMLLPPVRPDRAEYYGGLLAASIAQFAYGANAFRWFCDNDGVTRTVTRLGFECPDLPNPLSIECVRLSRGKTQRYHDRCHRACVWLREKGNQLLTSGEGFYGMKAVASNTERVKNTPWCVLDGRVHPGWELVQSELNPERVAWIRERLQQHLRATLSRDH